METNDKFGQIDDLCEAWLDYTYLMQTNSYIKVPFKTILMGDSISFRNELINSTIKLHSRKFQIEYHCLK